MLIFYRNFKRISYYYFAVFGREKDNKTRFLKV